MSIARYTIAVNDTGTSSHTTPPVNGRWLYAHWSPSAGDTGVTLTLSVQRDLADTGNDSVIFTNGLGGVDFYEDTGGPVVSSQLGFASERLKLGVVVQAGVATATVGKLYVYVDEAGR
jgi:hypothetical protein